MKRERDFRYSRIVALEREREREREREGVG